MNERMRDLLDLEAAEAEAVAEREERGELTPKPGQRARRPSEGSQVYSLRLPAEAIAELRELAELYGEPPSGLMRRFVLERLAQEQRRSEPANIVNSVVDHLLPLLRERMVERLCEVDVERRYLAGPHVPPRSSDERSTVPNLGPSRRTNQREQSHTEAIA